MNFFKLPKNLQSHKATSAVRKTLNNMIDTPLMALQNPQVVRTKEHLSDAQN
ncbi:10281_t:CDS:2 [Cetraspora pellucida]|uniref:10281_t:CDS:1 n=1 Tax=Cetraspora pellucida TaxID=1433469 RepID=A0ACA9KRD8_9GLOM|nr:10281_t:CDS:2 [Cetraspora pellucida]